MRVDERESPVAAQALCTQPDCALQSHDDRWFARLLVRVLAGDDVGDVMEREQCIVPREECVDCALQVMHGEAPLRTHAQQQRLIEIGHWSHRRRRRRDHDADHR